MNNTRNERKSVNIFTVISIIAVIAFIANSALFYNIGVWTTESKYKDLKEQSQLSELSPVIDPFSKYVGGPAFTTPIDSNTTGESDTNIEEDVEEVEELIAINTTDITQPSNLTAEQFDTLINEMLASKGKTNSALFGIGESLYKMEQEHKVNGLLALSVASLESGWGTSNPANNKNNLFGIYSNGSTKYFDNLDNNIQYFGELIRNHYIDKGYDTVSSIGSKYCTSSDWAGKVSSIHNKYQSLTSEIFIN